MARPYQDVKVFSIQDRRTNPAARRPWLVRWSVDGRQRVKAHRTKTEAERYRAALLHAVHLGERFVESTGEPASWTPETPELRVHEWVTRWLAEQWPEWQPRTRASALEAMTRFVPLAVEPTAPDPPRELRTHLVASLDPDSSAGGDERCQRWLDRWSIPLHRLNPDFLAQVDRGLGLGDVGQPLAASTSSRRRNNAKACVRRAVQLGLLPADPWPPTPRGRRRRKAVRRRGSVDTRRLPDPSMMARAIDAIASKNPASKTYQVMTAVAYYGGLRPSEVVMLRRRALDLPGAGWGRIEVVEADIAFDVSGEPKTGARSVPIPPVLVAWLREWVAERTFADADLIFRTRNGRRPSASNWSRAWHRAQTAASVPRMRVYDCRHAAATTWLKAGVPLGEVARRLGHTVETLVSTYVGALIGDEELANSRVEVALSLYPPSNLL